MSCLLLGRVQTHIPGGQSWRSGEISLSQALDRGDHVVRALGHESVVRAKARWRIEEHNYGNRVRFFMVRTDDGKGFNVETTTGRVLLYQNLGRIEDQFRKRLDRKTLQYNDKQVSQSYLAGLAKAVTGRSDLVSWGFVFTRDNETKDAIKAGHMAMNFATPDGAFSLSISADPLDGVVTFLAQTWKG